MQDGYRTHKYCKMDTVYVCHSPGKALEMQDRTLNRHR